jgi:pimeloyl-ACP methyl ester carboxylesterase
MTRGHDARAPEVSSYASVNVLQVYYEIHGTGRPLVLLHGAFSAIGTSFGELLPTLAETRQVSPSSRRPMGARPTSIAR